MRHLCIILIISFLSGCSSFKDITNPLEKKIPKTNLSSTNLEPIKTIDTELYFYRPKSFLTIGQRVELHFDGKKIGTLGHNKGLHYKTKTGTHNIATKVGLSPGLPVTGLGGACKFSKDFLFTKPKHYFVIKYRMGLLCGEHRILELEEEDYKKLM